jgi:ring-1,2-phenylacetyl-CoA epoxidase subunit PaaC
MSLTAPTSAATVTEQPLLLTYLLRLADDNLVLSQRLGELIAHMPELEEDIAVANIALDHLGQARNFYDYATDIDPAHRSEDDLAMQRSEREFLNAVLVEQPNGDFAHTVIRQLLVDAYQVPLYEALANSADVRLAGIAAKALKEARYHLEHSSAWVITLGDGTTESRARTQAALDHLWQFSADFFVTDQVESELLGQGVAADSAELRRAFDTVIAQVVDAAGLSLPSDPYQRLGGRTGIHTAHLGHLLPELQWLHRSHPGASW